MTRVLERGDAGFLYRPRIGVEQVRTLDDVARLFLVLDPDGPRAARLIVVGRKRLPDPSRHERHWAVVAEVAKPPEELGEELAPRIYETKTRGLRRRPEARPAGEGRYLLADHDGHSHLAYALERPREPGEAQRMFNIRRQASLIVAIRNPDAPAPPRTGLPRSRRAELPPDVLERFRGRRWISVDDPRLLDHEGVELVLIGASEDVEGELGVAFDADAENRAAEKLLAELGAAVRAGAAHPHAETSA